MFNLQYNNYICFDMRITILRRNKSVNKNYEEIS